MKTGSFALSTILSKDLTKKIGGGAPNFNYQPEPQNYLNANITAIRVSNLHNDPNYVYTASMGFSITSHMSVSGSVSGDSNHPLNAGSISIVAGW